MSRSLEIVGGVYAERCMWPDWDRVFGSAGRAACAVGANVESVILHSYASDLTAARFGPEARLAGVSWHRRKAERTVSFDYLHPLAVPAIRPTFPVARPWDALEVSAERVLRFGMLEATAKVDAGVCVHDPQSASDPERFSANGSRSRRLAIVANGREVRMLTCSADALDGARTLLKEERAEVVVVKAGTSGAFVVQAGGEVEHVPAYRSVSTWTIGSGDVFAAIFAAAWAVDLASKAVAEYSSSRALPARALADLAEDRPSAVALAEGEVYLAGPFFTMQQRWFVDETKRCLEILQQRVFSPVHEIGRGPASVVAPLDLEALRRCSALFAILDGLDSGTLYEVGYARALGIPVFAFAQEVRPEDLKMVEGSGCEVFSDFATALHATAWR